MCQVTGRLDENKMKGWFHHSIGLKWPHTMQHVGEVWFMWDIVSFAANTLSVLSAALPVCYHGYSHPFASEVPQFFLRTLLSEYEKVLYITWSIYWSWFCLGPPWGLAVLMKLLNEAERAHLCSDADDHACRWHGQTKWHFGANYADFTPAKIWIKLVLHDGWVLRDGTP